MDESTFLNIWLFRSVLKLEKYIRYSLELLTVNTRHACLAQLPESMPWTSMRLATWVVVKMFIYLYLRPIYTSASNLCHRLWQDCVPYSIPYAIAWHAPLQKCNSRSQWRRLQLLIGPLGSIPFCPTHFWLFLLLCKNRKSTITILC